MLTDAGFFVTVSFFLFVLVLVKKGGGLLASILDEKIGRIRGEFEALVKDRERALVDLDRLSHLMNQLDVTLNAMVEDAKNQVDSIHTQSREELSKLILQRKDLANEKIRVLKATFERLILQKVSAEIVEKVGDVLKNDRPSGLKDEHIARRLFFEYKVFKKA
jgi:F-type H+-transporting ATPase subunit b